jgi:hypothetical protein
VILFLYISNRSAYHSSLTISVRLNPERRPICFLSLSLSGRLYSHGCALQLLTVVLCYRLSSAHQRIYTIDFWRKNCWALCQKIGTHQQISLACCVMVFVVCCVGLFILLLYNCCWPLGILPPYPALDSPSINPNPCRPFSDVYRRESFLALIFLRRPEFSHVCVWAAAETI